MFRRMLGAASLDVRAFEEVEADRSATGQALLVVVIVALATGIGGLGLADPISIIVNMASAILGWALWAWIVMVLGTTLFRTPETRADWGEVARGTGFAQSPGVLRVLGFIPILGPIIFFIVSVWQIIAMVIAVRQALDYRSTWRALGVVIVGFIPYIVLLAIVSVFL